LATNIKNSAEDRQQTSSKEETSRSDVIQCRMLVAQCYSLITNGTKRSPRSPTCFSAFDFERVPAMTSRYDSISSEQALATLEALARAGGKAAAARRAKMLARLLRGMY